MIDYYTQFIKPKEIIKDINYFYDQIKELIVNDLFSKYIYNKRKKVNRNFTTVGYLSGVDKTRLRFNNDTIIVNFKVSHDPVVSGLFRSDERSNLKVSKPIYNNYKIDGIIITINVVLSPMEDKSKMIYSDNCIFRELRKQINEINDYYIKKFRKSEESKFKIIYYRINTIKKSYYSEWNKLMNLIKECVNPSFYKELCQFKPIIEGMRSNSINLTFKMIHETQFFKNYEHQRQLKFNKFIKALRKDCLDDNELLHMTNQLAWCFGHVNENLDECMIFLENIIYHFNTICFVKEMKINSFTSKVWGIQV